ncbi:MAG TPA: lytic transglycosylase [Flavobacterium sp.]|nr:lytic transglycosylase [Flavobacterium sp.]
MKIKNLLFFLLPIVSFAQLDFAQNTAQIVQKSTPLEILKASFVNHNTSTCIDTRWLEELTNQSLFDNMYADVSNLDIDQPVAYELSTETLKKKLQILDNKSPFNIEYNSSLENVIKSFLKNRKASFERLMAISEYYFPMFEEHLAKYNVPLEIKYLAIVESALNPKAKSRVGASGLWQFMYPTGKQFNLEVNSYIDERFDPLKATEAACQYLSSLYKIFGDWSLVLASYNAGPGTISKAIRRSGGSQNYWDIRKNLPKETANYVPAFLATMYIYEYKKELGIVPKKAPITYFETDTVKVKREMSFSQIAEIFDISKEQIAFLNPIYKLEVIPFDHQKPHYLRLPKDKIGLFVSNEEAIYAYLDFVKNGGTVQEKEPELVVQTQTVEPMTTPATKTAKEKKPVVVEAVKPKGVLTYHTIVKEENLGKIAKQYQVTVLDLIKWNDLRSSVINVGEKIKIYTKQVHSTTNETTLDAEVLAQSEPAKEETTKPEIKKPFVAKSNKTIYVVKSGDSLYTIAKKFPGVSPDDLKKWNDISGNKIRPGMKLKING